MKNNTFSAILFIAVSYFCSGSALAQDKYEMTVSADGSGDFKTIQQAIESCKSFPDRRIIIFVKNGIYHEKIVVPACNPGLSIIGESAEKTIIVYDDYFGKINRGRNSTFFTYTLLIEADDFIAENLTIENSAGPVGQAVALHVEGNRCLFRNCRILGNQDTLYTGGMNSCLYFTGCYIEGTTDFIFGASTALFDSCTIHSKANSFITAASTIKGKRFGYVFRGCNLTAADGLQKVFLGRPWRDFAKVVFLNCNLGPQIAAEGWANWQGTSRDKTAFFAEYGNSGPGAGFSGRVPWSHQLTRKEASAYTLKSILAPEKDMEQGPEQWTSMAPVVFKK